MRLISRDGHVLASTISAAGSPGFGYPLLQMLPRVRLRAWADFALWATEAARIRWPAAPGTFLRTL